METSLRELKSLTEELMTYARLDAPVAVHREQLDAYEVLEHVAATYPDSRLELPEDRDPPVRVDADERLLIRALCNLTANARRAASARIVLAVHRRGDAVHFSVDDDGEGVPEEDVNRIFEPFVRLDASRSRDRGGVGLGLSIVQRVAERHAGKVVVGRSYLGGACFTLVIPDGSSGPVDNSTDTRR